MYLQMYSVVFFTITANACRKTAGKCELLQMKNYDTHNKKPFREQSEPGFAPLPTGLGITFNQAALTRKLTR